MSKKYVILTRNSETKRIAFATPTAFDKINEAKEYGDKYLKDVDWLAVHSAFVKEIIEFDMWKNANDGDV